MKRWLLFIVFLIVAYPGTALPAPPNSPEWQSPILRRPVNPIFATTIPHGRVFTAPYGGEDLVGATYLGPAHLRVMSINVAMQLRDEAGLQRYAALVSDPRSL